MGNPFSSTPVNNYNTNPPSDDGAANGTNQVLWATIKIKLSDPLNTAFSALNTALSTAFGKVRGGAGITSVASDYTVQASDQGNLIKATASGITITTPNALTI